MIARFRAERGAGERLAGPSGSRRFHGKVGTRRLSGAGILRQARRRQRPGALGQHVLGPGGHLPGDPPRRREAAHAERPGKDHRADRQLSRTPRKARPRGPVRASVFAQWTRAKSFDTFGVFGPCIETEIDPSKLTVKTILNGHERQNYPLSDIVFPPEKLVSLISQDMTLEAGDVIACGSSVGVGAMTLGSTVSIVIEGIGTLTNKFE